MVELPPRFFISEVEIIIPIKVGTLPCPNYRLTMKNLNSDELYRFDSPQNHRSRLDPVMQTHNMKSALQCLECAIEVRKFYGK